MDEEYGVLRADLGFYQVPDREPDCKRDVDEIDSYLCEKTRYRQSNMNKISVLLEKNKKTICVPIEFEDNFNETPTQTPTADDVKIIKTNDVIFKSFFGATKNAIFRTAQSIIENHEKKTKNNKNDSDENLKSPNDCPIKKKDFFILKTNSSKNKIISSQTPTPIQELSPADDEPVNNNLKKSISTASLNKDKVRVPGIAHCLMQELKPQVISLDRGGHNGLLRFFESPVFNIHFAVHYLFYSKEPGVLSFIGNKVFSFPDFDVDLYMPQLILMYIQMDELAEVLDPYLVYRCRKSIDFSLKCIWLLEAYNYCMDSFTSNNSSRKTHLTLLKELYPKKERKTTKNTEFISPMKKTHHRSQSDATGLLHDSRKFPLSGGLNLTTFQNPPRSLCLGDLTTGRAFDNGCVCFDSVRGQVNGLLGQKTVCCCGAPKQAPQKEFVKALVDIGKTLTSLPDKREKTSRLRVLLNLINKNLPARVWLPIYSDIPHHIVRITEEKTAVLNSKDKTPYIIYVEVVEVSDIFSSPVIPKLMPTLRHTKSEEHLDLNSPNLPNQSTTAATTTTTTGNGTGVKSISVGVKERVEKFSESSVISDIGRTDLNEMHMTEDDVWSQEDDDITAQYLHLHKSCERDAISQMSMDSCDSRDQSKLIFFSFPLSLFHSKLIPGHFIPGENTFLDNSSAKKK